MGPIASFEGTILVVSHDRYFLNRIVHRVLAIEVCDIVDFSYYSEDLLERFSGVNES